MVFLSAISPVGAADHVASTVHHRVDAGEWLLHRPGQPGARYRSTPAGSVIFANYGWLLAWRPSVDDVGRHRFTQVATVNGTTTTTTVLVDVLAPARPDLLLAMGDSIASGHGLSKRDYFGLDDCWRDAGGAYSRRVAERLGLEHRMVACSSFEVADLWSRSVSGGPSDLSGNRSQLEWALDANPGLVTLTIGANDLKFDRPGDFFDDGVFLGHVARARIDSMQSDLSILLERLVTGTDADIVITSVHNPTSADPHGVSGCRGACFSEVVHGVSSDLNRAIADAAAAHPTRVLFADVGPAFVGHGAPNGRGPDWLRAGGGWFSSRLPIPTRGVHPFCERGHDDRDTWINAADCVHPNGEGHAAYAAAVLASLGR